MAKLSPVQKEARVLKLLMAMRNPRILGPMVSRGFQPEDAEEGWHLLRNAGKLPFDVALPVEADPSLVSWLDQWENAWFPVADASLERNFPEIHERVFLNLSQTEGPAVIVSVGTFIERVSCLRDRGERGQAALKLLARRGLTAAVLDDARAILARIAKPKPAAAPPNLEARRAEVATARAALWAWYLEWSQIARGVIKDGNSLRELGFLRGRRDAGDAEESGDADRAD